MTDKNATDTRHSSRSSGSACYVELKVYGGSHIEDAIQDAITIAKRLGCSVWFHFNGRHVLARPDDNPRKVLTGYERACENGWSTASGNDLPNDQAHL